MGVLIDKYTDVDMYKDAYEEAQRIIRISDEVRISLETVAPDTASPAPSKKSSPKTSAPANKKEKLTTSKLAKKLGFNTKELLAKLITDGYLEGSDDDHKLTEKGTGIGAEMKKGRYGEYSFGQKASACRYCDSQANPWTSLQS